MRQIVVGQMGTNALGRRWVFCVLYKNWVPQETQHLKYSQQKVIFLGCILLVCPFPLWKLLVFKIVSVQKQIVKDCTEVKQADASCCLSISNSKIPKCLWKRPCNSNENREILGVSLFSWDCSEDFSVRCELLVGNRIQSVETNCILWYWTISCYQM